MNHPDGNVDNATAHAAERILRFKAVFEENLPFLEAFDKGMEGLGYTSERRDDGTQMVYMKAGVKSEKPYVRVFADRRGLVLRFHLFKVEKHADFIADAPSHIRDVFAGPGGGCRHCTDDKEDRCGYRRTYVLDGEQIEKCGFSAFCFRDVDVSEVDDYVAMFREFYPERKKGRRK